MGTSASGLRFFVQDGSFSMSRSVALSLGERPRGLFSVVQPELFFLSIPPCPLRLGRGAAMRQPPCTPHAPRGSTPWDPVSSSRPWTWAGPFGALPSLRSGRISSGVSGAVLTHAVRCGVSLRAMPRSARLSRQIICICARLTSAYLFSECGSAAGRCFEGAGFPRATA